jgi:hypothetical protein
LKSQMPQDADLAAKPVDASGVLEKSFVCICQKARITIKMLPGRTVPIVCRCCEQVYEATVRNGEILVQSNA